MIKTSTNILTFITFLFGCVLCSESNSSLYDTYHAGECKRIRKPWFGLSITEKELYRDGLLELRKRGHQSMEFDDFIAVSSIHDDHFASITHHDSDYFFYHAYIVWELESRIRNLGGKYKCFGMPYWDITQEYTTNDNHIIEEGILGGLGDPDNNWVVNEYSWDVTIEQYWRPNGFYSMDHCNAKGDHFPICALQRNPTGSFNLDTGDYAAGYPTASELSQAIIDNNNFIEFNKYITQHTPLWRMIDTSYDPIWYLYHSFQSYWQAMWINYHKYYLIDNDDLYKHKEAYSPYCEVGTNDDIGDVSQCVGIKLDDPLFFNAGELLPQKTWAYIYDHDLTIKKLYKLPQWNVIYDLRKDTFYTESGLDKYCEGKLSEEWFILPQVDENKILNLLFHQYSMYKSSYIQLFIAIVLFGVCGCALFYLLKGREQKLLRSSHNNEYGTF